MYILLLRSVLAAGFAILIVHFFKKQRLVLFAALLIYVAAVVYFVGIRGNRTGLSGVNFSNPFPFYRAIRNHHYGVTANRSVLNIVLLIPFGYLVPQMISLNKPKESITWWHIVLLGFAGSLLIETCQLVLRFGVFDIDDLVKNTMGAAIGFAIWILLEFRKND